MAGKPPVSRIKAKRKDGTELPTKDRDGKPVRVARREIGVVWENEGRKTLRFAPDVQAAIEKVLGGECYFDVYDTESKGATGGKASAEDDDF